jgi:rubredoxin
MQRHVCGVCGYVYDPAQGDPRAEIAPGTVFEQIPETWHCPNCGSPKDVFDPED